MDWYAAIWGDYSDYHQSFKFIIKGLCTLMFIKESLTDHTNAVD